MAGKSVKGLFLGALPLAAVFAALTAIPVAAQGADVGSLIYAMIPAFIAYYLAALGHGVFETSGVLNLAIDGVFTLSVAAAFSTAVHLAIAGYEDTLAAGIGVLVAGVIGAFLGVFLAFITTKLPISHGAAGLSLMFVGYGLAPWVGLPAAYMSQNILRRKPLLNTDPVTVYGLMGVAILLGILLYFIITNTKIGVAIRAAGENPHAASALGISVVKTRVIAALLGYTLIGIGGGIYYALYAQTWQEGSGMGSGWIAFAISLSAGRHPILTMISAAVFAGILKHKYFLASELNLSRDVANMLPFLVALIAMVIFMATPLKRKLAPPSALGKIFFREERTV